MYVKPVSDNWKKNVGVRYNATVFVKHFWDPACMIANKAGMHFPVKIFDLKMDFY